MGGGGKSEGLRGKKVLESREGLALKCLYLLFSFSQQFSPVNAMESFDQQVLESEGYLWEGGTEGSFLTCGLGRVGELWEGLLSICFLLSTAK